MKRYTGLVKINLDSTSVKHVYAHFKKCEFQLSNLWNISYRRACQSHNVVYIHLAMPHYDIIISHIFYKSCNEKVEQVWGVSN